MRKLISALLIVFLLSVSAALADTGTLLGKPAANERATGSSGTIGAAGGKPAPAQHYDVLVDTTPGSTLTWYGAPGTTPPAGPTWKQLASNVELDQAHITYLQRYGTERQPTRVTAETVEFDYVTAADIGELRMFEGAGFTRTLTPDGKTSVTTISAGTPTAWTGPDKFTVDAKGATLYDNKPISTTPDDAGNYHFLDPATKEQTASYVNPITGGGALTSDAGKVTISDASGKTISTFTDKQWAAWTDKFSAANLDESGWVSATYIVRDLNLNPSKVQTSPEGTRLFTDSVEVTFNNGQATVTQGKIDPTTGAVMPNTAYTQKTFTLDNGRQVVSNYKEVDDKGQTQSEYTYGATSWTVTTRENGNLKTSTISLATYGTTAYPLLGEVNGVKVVMDPQTRAIRYFGADDKELKDAALDKFLAEKTNSDAVDKLKDSETAATARDGINKNRLASCPASECGQFNSFDQFLGTFTQYFNNYAGLAGWSSLIFDSKFLADWQKGVNDLMCNQLHLPTTSCWTSQICGRYVKIDTPRDGVLITASPGGAIQAVAHIEGQKSLPANAPNATYYAYTVTFGLTNPTDDTMNYNVRFIAKDNSATWWPAAQSLGKGGMVSAIGAQALNKVSSRDYGTVCLEFNPAISSFSGTSVGKICNDFAQYAGGATAPYSTGNQTNTTSGTGSTTAPSGTAAPVAPGASI